MNRLLRTTLNLALPCAIASVCMIAKAALFGVGSAPGASLVNAVFFSVIWCFMYGAIPSVVYAFVMEVFYRRGLQPASTKAIGVGVMYGVGCAVVCWVFFSSLVSFGAGTIFTKQSGSAAIEYLEIDALTGLIVSTIVYFVARLRTASTAPAG